MSSEASQKLKIPEGRQVQERLVLTLEHMQAGQDQVLDSISGNSININTSLV